MKSYAESTTLNLQLALSQQGVLIPRSTDNLEAYDDLLRGLEYTFSVFTKDGNLKARQMFEKAIALDPKYAWAYATLGWNYWFGWSFGFNPDPNGLQRALALEQQAVALDDSLATAHSALARIYMNIGRYDQAVSEAQRGIALDPNSALGYFWLADILNAEAKPAEALEAAETAMRLDPRNTTYLYEPGWAYSLLGRRTEAIPALKRDLVRYPDHLWAHSLLGSDYSFLGDEDGARTEAAALERAIAASPNSPTFYVALAYLQNSMGKPAEALVAMDKAMRLDPRSRDNYSWFSLEQGFAFTLLGRPQEAIPALKRYLARYPDDFWARAYLAVDYMELGQNDAARPEAADALRLAPQLTVEMVFPTVSLQRKALPAEIDRFRADLHRAGLK
jgi:tetratricopeptide (TPR) repeat protein